MRSDRARMVRAIAALRGYTMDHECFTEWERRCTFEHLRALYDLDPDRLIARLKILAERLIVRMIMEAQARGSRTLILADLQNATAELAENAPFSEQN